MGFYCFVDVADFFPSLFPPFFTLHAIWSFLSFVTRVFSRSYIRSRRVPRVLWRVYPGKFQHPTRLPLIPGGHDSHAMMIEMKPFPFLAFLFFFTSTYLTWAVPNTRWLTLSLAIPYRTLQPILKMNLICLHIAISILSLVKRVCSKKYVHIVLARSGVVDLSVTRFCFLPIQAIDLLSTTTCTP